MKYFQQMDPRAQHSLLDFAAFLAVRGEPAEKPPAGIQDISRPEEESVIQAIKRLAATYPMLDRDDMLSETSALMTGHVMQGRPAIEVIDELEAVFRTHYKGFQT